MSLFKNSMFIFTQWADTTPLHQKYRILCMPQAWCLQHAGAGYRSCEDKAQHFTDE
jgi:hypothetical protein